jgi:hypothetical protein
MKNKIQSCREFDKLVLRTIKHSKGEGIGKAYYNTIESDDFPHPESMINSLSNYMQKSRKRLNKLKYSTYE